MAEKLLAIMLLKCAAAEFLVSSVIVVCCSFRWYERREWSKAGQL